MPLIMSFRRWWAAIFVAILLLPALGHFLPDAPAPMRTVLAPEARWWEDAARRLDPWINNTFGFRGAVLAAHRSYVRFIGDSQSRLVLKGEHGALYLNSEKAVEQSIGQVVRPEEVAHFLAFAQRMNAYMTAQGGRFVVVVAPNGQTANFELLPAYARQLKKSPTEFDLVAQGLKAEGVAFADVRPLFTEAKKTGPVHWLYDTHWNRRGALIAFNATMVAAGRPDLQISADDALGPPEPTMKGDLARMGGITPARPDVDYPPKGPTLDQPGQVEMPGVMQPVGMTDPFESYAYSTGHAGPRILVIGDSFTQGFWRGWLAYRASAYGWTHHRYCRFDMGAVERFKPDILIYAPTERAMQCKGEPFVAQDGPGQGGLGQGTPGNATPGNATPTNTTPTKGGG